jgi:hypothetical protein
MADVPTRTSPIDTNPPTGEPAVAPSPAAPAAPSGSIDGKFSIQGRVIGLPSDRLSGVLVRAYDQDLRKRQKLGEAHIVDGAYTVHYPKEQAAVAEKDTPDLLVIAYTANDEELARAPIRFKARPSETIDLVVEQPQVAAPSEFESVTGTVMPLLEGQDVELHMLEQTAEHQDISFLLHETGLPADQIIGLIAAARLAHQALQQTTTSSSTTLLSADAAPAGKPPTSVLLPVFYGLVRQGLPQDLPGLLNRPISALRTALETSLARNVVSASLTTWTRSLPPCRRCRSIRSFSRPRPAPMQPWAIS